MFDPETIGELMTELRQRAAGDRAAERRVAQLADELKRQPALEDDAKFRSRVAEAVQGFERGGVAIPMTPELRASLEAEPKAPEQQRQAAPQQQTQTRTGAALNTMAQLYAALRPTAPATPPPWEQAPQPLGDRLRAFEQRMSETAAANQTHAAQQAGEHALSALDGLSATPGGATLAKVRDAAQNEPGGIGAVVEGMAPGGRFAELRSAFNAALAQDREFASTYDRAVSDISTYAEARLKVGSPGDQFESMDRAIGQASQALPGRKDGKSAQDELAEKAAKLAEFLKNAVLRVGTALSSAPAPKPGTSPTLAMTP